MKPRTIDQLIDAYHQQGNTSFVGTASGHIALRTKQPGALWHYYTNHPTQGYYQLTGTTKRLER